MNYWGWPFLLVDDLPGINNRTTILDDSLEDFSVQKMYNDLGVYYWRLYLSGLLFSCLGNTFPKPNPSAEPIGYISITWAY